MIHIAAIAVLLLTTGGLSEAPAAEPGESPVCSWATFVPGYRLQLHSTRSDEAARSFAEAVEPFFEEDVHIVFERPYYLVQVGDFQNEEEAATLVDQAVERGLGPVSIVPALVTDASIEPMVMPVFMASDVSNEPELVAAEETDVDPIPMVTDASIEPMVMPVVIANAVSNEPELMEAEEADVELIPAVPDLLPEENDGPTERVAFAAFDGELAAQPERPHALASHVTTAPAGPAAIDQNNSGVIYRVQLHATKSREKADRVAEQLRPLFGDEVYVEFHEPFFRVRVGNCKTAKDAHQVKARAAEHHFERGWVVRIAS